tara:strand:- start:1089 stop:1415 length:327 start_codon:yes stop_codon:yes gene_type:complete
MNDKQTSNKLNPNIMNIHDLSNFRKINVTFLAPTNYKGARIKLTEPKSFEDGKSTAVIISYDYGSGGMVQQALDYLVDKGFNPVSRSSEYNMDTILCDNWGDNFTELK